MRVRVMGCAATSSEGSRVNSKALHSESAAHAPHTTQSAHAGGPRGAALAWLGLGLGLVGLVLGLAEGGGARG